MAAVAQEPTGPGLLAFDGDHDSLSAYPEQLPKRPRPDRPRPRSAAWAGAPRSGTVIVGSSPSSAFRPRRGLDKKHAAGGIRTPAFRERRCRPHGNVTDRYRNFEFAEIVSMVEQTISCPAASGDGPFALMNAFGRRLVVGRKRRTLSPCSRSRFVRHFVSSVRDCTFAPPSAPEHRR